MSLIPVDDVAYVFLVTADYCTVNLRLDPGRQRRGVDKVGEDDRQPSDFALVNGGSEKVFGFCIAAIYGQHLSGQGVGGRSITLGKSPKCAIEQVVDACCWLRSAHSANKTCSVVSGVTVPGT